MKYNTKTITLTTDTVRTLTGNKCDTKLCEAETELRAKALAILLGEYNKYGREIKIEEVEKLQDELENTIKKMEELLKQ